MEQLKHRHIGYEGIHCNLAMEQFPSGVVVLKLSGSDVGEFGEAPMLALDEWLADGPSVDLFIDARDVHSASLDVSGEWAAWLGKNKTKLQSVTMLTGSRFIHITAEFVRRFAALEGKMRICTDPDVFKGELEEVLNPD